MTTPAGDDGEPCTQSPGPVLESIEEVARRAYEKWAQRSSTSDGELRDWFEAEAELCQLRELRHQVQLLQQSLEKQLSAVEVAQYRLTVEHAIAGVLSASSSLTDAAAPILECLCVSLGWCLGVMWRVDQPALVLRCTDVFQKNGLDCSDFVTQTRSLTLAAGIGLPGQVWVSKSPVLIQNFADAVGFPRARTAAGKLFGAAAFPILDGADVLGVMEFYSRRPIATDDDIAATMWRVGTQISSFIERRAAERQVRRQENDRRLAGMIQQRLLPKQIPVSPEFEISGRCVSALDVGGDCFDYLTLHDGDSESLGILIADASGHNVGSALLVAEVRGVVRTLAMTSADVGQIFATVNRRIADDMECVGFATALLLCLSPEQNTLTYANAGHWPAVVFDADGQVRATLTGDAYPLGIDLRSSYASQAAEPLADRELILLYTDGTIEAAAADGELFGRQRLIELIQQHWSEPPGQMLESVIGALLAFADGVRLGDDATIVLIRRTTATQEFDQAA